MIHHIAPLRTTIDSRLRAPTARPRTRPRGDAPGRTSVGADVRRRRPRHAHDGAGDARGPPAQAVAGWSGSRVRLGQCRKREARADEIPMCGMGAAGRSVRGRLPARGDTGAVPVADGGRGNPHPVVAARAPRRVARHRAGARPVPGRLSGTKGEFVIEVTRAGPHGADRFFNLVKNGFYDDAAFFRAIANFMVQFGIHGDPAVSPCGGRRAFRRTP